LSPFVNKGYISEYFKQSGKIPGDNLLHICVRGELMEGDLIFNNLVDISSYPWEFFTLRDLNKFATSLGAKDLGLIFRKGPLQDCRKWCTGIVFFF
jgi:hypothetical protein